MSSKSVTKVIDIDDNIVVSEGEEFEQSSDRFAIYVGYSEDVKVKQGDLRIINALRQCGYQVIFVRATDSEIRKIDWGNFDLSASIASIVRGNHGYDFGSWALALSIFPKIKSAKYVLLLNDSILGPFGDLQPLLTSFESSKCDVWAATINNEFFPHLQSFFVGYKNMILATKVLSLFWNEISVQETKDAVIQKYELGLSRLLFSEAFIIDAAFPSEIIVDYALNPTIIGWERLMDLGFPFLKKMVIEQPQVTWDGLRAPGYIQRKYQENVWDLLK